MVEERVFMGDGNCIKKKGGRCLKRFIWPEFVGNSKNNPGGTSKNLGGGSRSRK